MGARDRYPGALGFGYVELVPAAELERYAAVVRADPVPGFPKVGTRLKITPEGRRTTYCLIRLAVSGVVAQLVPGGAGYDLCAVSGADSFLAPLEAGRISAASAAMPLSARSSSSRLRFTEARRRRYGCAAAGAGAWLDGGGLQRRLGARRCRRRRSRSRRFDLATRPDRFSPLAGKCSERPGQADIGCHDRPGNRRRCVQKPLYARSGWTLGGDRHGIAPLRRAFADASTDRLARGRDGFWPPGLHTRPAVGPGPGACSTDGHREDRRAPLPSAARRSDRAPEPALDPRPSGAAGRRGPQSPDQSSGTVPGPRRLQGGQRHVRARGRRRTARGGCGPDLGRGARRRHRRSARRRRVCRSCRERHRRGARRARRRAAARGAPRALPARCSR